mgnify:CR=1 FL=1
MTKSGAGEAHNAEIMPPFGSSLSPPRGKGEEVCKGFHRKGLLFPPSARRCRRGPQRLPVWARFPPVYRHATARADRRPADSLTEGQTKRTAKGRSEVSPVLEACVPVSPTLRAPRVFRFTMDEIPRNTWHETNFKSTRTGSQWATSHSYDPRRVTWSAGPCSSSRGAPSL